MIPQVESDDIRFSKGKTVRATSPGVLKCIIILSCVVAVVALATVFGALYQESPELGTRRLSRKKRATEEDMDRKKTWLIGRGHDYGAYDYLHTDGYVKGFYGELIAEVCTAAGIKCDTVWDLYYRCLDSQAGLHMTGSYGLMARWYHACAGWLPTKARVQIFGFSSSFLKQDPSYFYVKPGDTSFNPTQIDSNRKVAFLDGWASDEKCLASQTGIQGNVLPVGQIVHVKTTDQFAEMITSGQVQAGFSLSPGLEPYVSKGTLKAVGGPYNCAFGGSAMMARKDSRFHRYWNEGFAKIMSNGRFRTMCQEAQKNHGHKGQINCVDS